MVHDDVFCSAPFCLVFVMFVFIACCFSIVHLLMLYTVLLEFWSCFFYHEHITVPQIISKFSNINSAV